MSKLARLAATLSFCLLASACGSTGGGTDAGASRDLTAPGGDMTLLSECGKPGDTGNSLGVGRFCTRISDCTEPGMRTNLCSNLGNGAEPSPSDTYFCTIYPCKPDAGADACGEEATCVCGSAGGTSGCACTPDRCLTP